MSPQQISPVPPRSSSRWRRQIRPRVASILLPFFATFLISECAEGDGSFHQACSTYVLPSPTTTGSSSSCLRRARQQLEWRSLPIVVLTTTYYSPTSVARTPNISPSDDGFTTLKARLSSTKMGRAGLEERARVNGTPFKNGRGGEREVVKHNSQFREKESQANWTSALSFLRGTANLLSPDFGEPI